ncbi:MAG TPA: putative DNA-binding protein [Candidatus Avamphibacillus sp.]|nr:putative DNA-binding protein [Candidatus Avamphibacillus sp.]
MLEKTVRINYLFDFYQALLTPKQRDYMGKYYLRDYSLGEIAENAQVSRQAIYDNIKRTETMLESYEETLKLYEKFKQRMLLIEQMEEYLEEENYVKVRTSIQQLKELD